MQPHPQTSLRAFPTGNESKFYKMPKKFKEVNTKAAAAKERKASVKREEDERKRQSEEDEYWRDDDKTASRKQERKVKFRLIKFNPPTI